MQWWCMFYEFQIHNILNFTCAACSNNSEFFVEMSTCMHLVFKCRKQNITIHSFKNTPLKKFHNQPAIFS